MFLERIGELGLLQHDPESNILSQFPLLVRKKMIHEVTQCLLPNSTQVPDPPILLTSPAHVRWAMEVVGQGFALPIEESSIIQAAVTVYSGWLLEPATRPVAIQELRGTEVEQKFWQQTIFMQLSLLYQPREKGESSAVPSFSKSREPEEPIDMVFVHVEICKNVLRIFTLAGRALGAEFSEETWIVFLKVVLGVSDRLLREPIEKDRAVTSAVTAHPPSSSLLRGVDRHQANFNLAGDWYDPGPRMGDDLCEHLIRVLIELWLRSGIRRIAMWECLKARFRTPIFPTYFVYWTHRVAVIHQWNATILGLTQRVVRLLYGPTEGADSVFIHVNAYTVSLDLSQEFIFYSWHRMIYMIGNPNDLRAANFEVAIHGISTVVDVWHTEGATAPKTPDGNTLLHMFGGWLFEAGAKKEPEFEEGKSEALGILCQIFCQPQRRQKFLRTYLERFYTALIEGLHSDTLSLTSIIMNGGDLFARELEGLRMLLPDFVAALRRVLPRLEPSFHTHVAAHDLRRGAMKVMGGIFALPNRFGEVLLRAPWEMGVARKINDEVATSRMIKAIYAKANDTPTTAFPEGPEATFNLVKSDLVDLLCTSLIQETFPNNTRCILHLLACLVMEDVAFSPGLPSVVIRTIQDKLANPGQWTSEVILCAFQTLNHFTSLWDYIKRDNKTNQLLIIRAYDCMIRWAIVGQWIAEDRDCHNAVISTLCRGIGVLDRDDDFAIVAGQPLGAGSTGLAAGLGGPGSGSAPSLGSSLAAPFSGLSSSMSGNIKELGLGNATSSSPSTTGPDKKRTIRGAGTAASKLITMIRATATLGNSIGGVSTGTKDNGIGLPTFATLSAEISVQGAAEFAMAQLANHLGSFPPFGEVTGVSRISSLWNEEKELRRIDHQGVPTRGEAEDPSLTAADCRAYARYFAYDNRVIFGIVDIPDWASAHEDCVAEQPSGAASPAIDAALAHSPNALTADYRGSEKKGVRSPCVTLVLRDGAGKSTWVSSLKYVEDPEEPPRSPLDPSMPLPEPAPHPHSSSSSSPSSSSILSASSEDSTPESLSGHTSDLGEDTAQRVDISSPAPAPAIAAAPHFAPAPMPYRPRDAPVVHLECVNDSSIPKLENIVVLDTEDGRSFEAVKKLTERQIAVEEERVREILPSLDTAITSPPVINREDPENGTKSFRLFLSQMGYLNLENRPKLVPLAVTPSLLRDLEKFDSLPERDCFGVSVLFSRSGSDSAEDILQPKIISSDFDEFVYCLGWPVDLRTHAGYKGNLTAVTCATAPYYANRNVEVIFHSPYLYQCSFNS
ncbi:hypothetical protein BDK51DRAFT_11033, partial [Blyttiomyces helicus]